jgi:hypothetical protein
MPPTDPRVTDAEFLALVGADAQKWAGEFCRRFTIVRRGDQEPMDEGLMVGWFANAIAAGEGTRGSDPSRSR